MITEKDIQTAIAECQGARNPNANTCIKLAAYYIIKDHMNEEPKYSYAAEPMPIPTMYSSDSEFGQAIRNMDINEVLSVMDELMETLNVLNPRLYNGVMSKLSY